MKRDANIVENMVNKTLKALATNRRAQRAPVICSIEANSGDAMYIAEYIRKWAATYGINMFPMSEVRDGKEQGCPKDAIITKKLISATICMLAARTCCIAEDCVSISSDFARPQHTMADERRELKSQFLRYRLDPKLDKYTGKDGAGQNDDFIVAFMMTIYWSMQFMQNTRIEYDQFKRNVGMSGVNTIVTY